MPDPCILLVDDVDFFLEIEKHFLRRTPAQIRTAKNGREALDAASRHRPDLIYMDMNMPVMDGVTCCRTLKQDPELGSIPVIMVLAARDQEDLDRCRAAGCDEIITKPVDKRQFLELGHKYLFHVDRRELRIAFRADVEFRLDGGASLQGETHDLSENGLFVKSREPVQRDGSVRLWFTPPTGDFPQLEVRGRIAWVNQGFPRPNLRLPQGFGVEFRQLDLATRDRLRQLVTRLS